MCSQWAFVAWLTAITGIFCCLPHLLSHFGFQFDLHQHFYHKSTNDENPNVDTDKLEGIPKWRKVSSTAIKSSSIYCSDSNGHELPVSCRFESLCLKIDSNEYIINLNKDSQFYPPDKLKNYASLNYGYLSSVSGHNAYSFGDLVTIPHSEIQTLSQLVYIISEKTVIMSRFKPDNLMHLIHDDLIPLFSTMQQLGLNPKTTSVFLDDFWNNSTNFDLFKQLFPNTLHKTNFNLDSIVCFENAIIGVSNSSIWYQYGFKKFQGPIQRTDQEMVYIRKTIHSFKKYLSVSYNLPSICSESKSLLIVRTQNRRILNYIQLFNHLKSKFENLQILLLDNIALNDKLKLKELFHSFCCVHTLIAMHGSEHILSLLMTASVEWQSLTVIELFPYGIEATMFTPYRTLAQLLGHRYFAWTNTIKANSVFHSDYPAKWGGLTHLDRQQQLRIVADIDQPLQPFLCCSDPDWLYRIYQDTIVDLDLFDQVVKTIQSKPTQQHQSEDPTVHRLSAVTNLGCVRNNQTLTIVWQVPWNAVLVVSNSDSLVLHYQVLVQCVGTDQASLWNTNQTKISIFLPCHNTNVCYVWVKPSIPTHANVVGFFDKIPYVCQF